MRGPYSGYGFRGYDPRGVYRPRDPREFEHHRHSAPSPWIPATILGVVLLITGMPYLKSPPEPPIAYQTVMRTTSSFPLPLLWIPVIAFLALQFFGGHWYHGYGDDGYGRPGIRGYGAYGAAPDAYRSRGVGPYRMRAERYQGWGGWWPWSSPSWNTNYYGYNNHQQRGLMSTFMDYGGHWFLILLGIAVFTLVGSSSLPTPPAVLPIPPLAPRTLGFPWNLFF